jgi:membrane protease YdiL (CAAX protease family)
MTGWATQPHDDRLAAKLRGFGPIGILAFIAILAGNSLVVPLSPVLVLLWAWRSRTPWRELGFVRPRSWVRTVLAAVAFGIAFKLAMKAIVMPLLGADPINHAYHYLAGNTAALPAILFLVTIGAGFGEEAVFRGYLFERLGKLFGTGAGAKAAIVLLTSAWFAAAHYPEQGVAGVEQAAITGLVFGTIFARTGRLWTLIFAHAAFDVAAVAIIYWDAESTIAHLVFK